MNAIYGPNERRRLEDQVDFVCPPQTPESVKETPSLLEAVEIIFSGWGGPRLDTEFLNAAPHLQAFFYGAGATGGSLSPAVWEKGITVVSAASVNAIPVAEYTIAAIVFALKNVLPFARQAHEQKQFSGGKHPVIGAYKKTVGLVSFGLIGRAVRDRLRLLDVSVLVHDPFLSEADAAASGVECVSLEALFTRADVVSLHTPWLPETEGMITGPLIASMRPGTTLINTARGAIIREPEMIEVLAARPDLTALLDVTYPEPPVPDSPLWSLPNVFLTPHIAGSIGDECHRMGSFIVDELERFLRGDPLLGVVRAENIKNTAHFILPT